MVRISAASIRPGPRLRVVIVSTGLTGLVRLDTALTPPAAPAPTPGSRLWSFAGSGGVGSEVSSPPLIPGTRAWFRASPQDEVGKRVGAYTNPVSVVLPRTPQFSDVTLHVDEGGAVVQWAPSGATEEVEVRAGMALEEGAIEFGPSSPLPAFPAAHAPALRPPIGYALEVEVTPRDGGQLLTLDGEELATASGERVRRLHPTAGTPIHLRHVRPLDVGTAVAPRGWVFTVEGHPVRTADFRVVLEAGVQLPTDAIMTVSGLPVRVATLEIVRTAA